MPVPAAAVVAELGAIEALGRGLRAGRSGRGRDFTTGDGHGMANAGGRPSGVGTEQAKSVMRLENHGADARTRTADLLITNQLLYQLSYVGVGPAREDWRAAE